eukprot:Skav201585  [mRNA]  locus=scaffold152:371920:372681:- [translate_table: standard]
MFCEVVKQFPGLRDRFPVSQQGNAAKTYADGLLVVCNHARRISRDDGRLAEACSKMTQLQAKKLEEMASWLKKSGEKKPKRFEGDGLEATPAKKKKKAEEEKSVSPGTQALLDEYQIPATQDMEEDTENEGLLASAQKAKPIPVRKALLKAEVALKRPASCKRPTAAGKAADKTSGVGKLDDGQKVTQPLILMPYNKLGSCAVRIKGGQQILQVKSPKGMEQSKKIAGELKKMLEDGKTVGEVKASKRKKLQK